MSKSKSRKKSAKKAAKRSKAAQQVLKLLPAQIGFSDESAFADGGVKLDDRLLETYRTHWQYGEWAELAALTEEGISGNKDRAKLALLAAAGRSNVGDFESATHFLRRAALWGCDSRLISQIMISTVHNSLGRAAACLNDTNAATEHFETAIRLVEPRAATALLGRTRQVRELARLGLLPDAERLLQVDLAIGAADISGNTARLSMIKTELDLLKNELSLALQRRQIFADPSDSASDHPHEGLASRSVSQIGQDIWVLEQSHFQHGGFFVDFGATDGVLFSNTLLLEHEFGWSGICAEPNPNFFQQLTVNRKCKVLPSCIGGITGEKVEFILADVYGGIAEFAATDTHLTKRDAYRLEGEVIKLNTISLDDFLTQNGAPKVIDYLSIDTEGSEYSILKTFPFNKWTIRFITVEHNFTPMRESIRALLEPLGYRRTEAKFDDWYALTQ